MGVPWRPVTPCEAWKTGTTGGSAKPCRCLGCGQKTPPPSPPTIGPDKDTSGVWSFPEIAGAIASAGVSAPLPYRVKILAGISVEDQTYWPVSAAAGFGTPPSLAGQNLGVKRLGKTIRTASRARGRNWRLGKLPPPGSLRRGVGASRETARGGFRDPVRNHRPGVSVTVAPPSSSSVHAGNHGLPMVTCKACNRKLQFAIGVERGRLTCP